MISASAVVGSDIAQGLLWLLERDCSRLRLILRFAPSKPAQCIGHN
jgi:hypothetical protein